MINRKTLLLVISILFLLLLSTGGIIFLHQKDLMMMRNPVLVHEPAFITYISGESYYLDSETGEWREPDIGQKLPPGTSLKTMQDGEMDIRMNTETLIKMDHEATMVIRESSLHNLKIDLEEGRLYGRFHKLFSEQKLEVTTDEIVAGIRGTDLVFEADKENTRIYALSGITEVYAPDFPENRLLLSFQKQISVKEGEVPPRPEDMDPAQAREFQKVLNAIHRDKVFLVTRAIQFEANSDTILDLSLPELETLYKNIKKSKYTLEIAGHTADIGSANAQYELSLRRARAVKDYLVEKGISEKRFRVSGYGGSRPVSDNLTEEGRARNRRVEFLIIE